MQPQQYQPAPQMPAPNSGGTQPDYGFITNPQQPQKQKTGNPLTGQSMLIKIIVIAVGVLLLLIVFGVIKNLSSGGSNTAALVTVVQNQQQLTHIANAAGEQNGTSTTTRNSAITIETSVASSQQQLLSYMRLAGAKVSEKQLTLLVSSNVDSQLTAAVAAGNYDSTYASVMTTQLTAYKKALQAAYTQTTGPKGKALLNSQFNQANLLLQQISPTN